MAALKKRIPYLLYSDENGEIYEDKSLLAIGSSGIINNKLNPEDFIELPEGSDFFHLPGRNPIGFNPITNAFEVCRKGYAVAAFTAPAYTITHHAAWETLEHAPILPLFAYAAIGWLNNKFYVTALRIDPDIRQDCKEFNQKTVIKNAKIFSKNNPDNRLLKHLSHCALVYLCPAARNYFLNRWEAPLPTSPSCNSNCLGCISYQPKQSGITSTQNRITFIPTPKEIAEIAIEHLNTAPNPIVSFGQGCEGEPLMVWQTIRDSIMLIRKTTQKGIINLNTNASNPEAIKELCKVGLQSMRVSINSVKKENYIAYYNPNNYSFENVLESIKIARKNNIWVSINYFVFPGITDTESEYLLLRQFIKYYDINMIQWRNFNIDPEWYLKKMNVHTQENTIGIKTMISNIHKEFPHLYNGYFNPGEKIIKNL